MSAPTSPPTFSQGRWTSLWVVAGLSLLAQLWLCQFFSFGAAVPATVDINPSNLWQQAYSFPPNGDFYTLNWLGRAHAPLPLNPFSLGALLSPWLFFTVYTPFIGTCALLAMAAFLRELDLPRPAALFGATVYAWQGDLITFVYPAHFGYITTWPFFALAAWGALRALRTNHWAYAVISGLSCGFMVQLQQDRGAIACLLIAVLYLAPVWRHRGDWKFGRPFLIAATIFGGAVLVIAFLSVIHAFSDASVAKSAVRLGLVLLFGTSAFSLLVFREVRHLFLCVATAALITISTFLALFQTNIVGVKMGGQTDREVTYELVTQWSLGPAETLTYLVPGFFGWHNNHPDGPYWGWIGQTLDWSKLRPPANGEGESTPLHHGWRNFNQAISTTGTAATFCALIGIGLLLPGRLFGPDGLSARQRFFGRVLLVMGTLTLVLSWGWHTPFYRPLFALPLMDKWRNPLKWLEMTNFALVTLSAFGVQQLLATLDDALADRALIRKRLAWFAGGMLGLLALGTAATHPFNVFFLAGKLAEDTYAPQEIANIMTTVSDTTLVATLIMALICLLLFIVWHPEGLRNWKPINPLLQQAWARALTPAFLPLTLAVGLAIVSTAQLYWVAKQFIAPESLALLTEINPLVAALKADSPIVRCSVATEDPLLRMLLLNQFNAARISSIDISSASRIPDDVDGFFGTLAPNRARLWFLSGVRDIAVPQEFLPQLRADPDINRNIDTHNIDGFTLLPTGSDNLPSHAIVRMKDYLAKATLVPAAEIIPDDSKLLNRLANPSWNPRATLLLKEPLPGGPGTDHAPSPEDRAGTRVYTPDRMEVDVYTAAGAYLLVNDQYDPDWTAEIDGKPVPMVRADFIMRAVAVPPGSHTVTFSYATRYHVGDWAVPALYVNLFCDGLMLAAWLLAGLALWLLPTRRDVPWEPAR